MHGELAEPGMFNTLLTSWDVALAASDRLPTTRRRYLGVLRDFLGWYEQQNHESFTPTRLTPIDLTAYRGALQARNTSPSAINVAVCALRAFCDWLVETQQCTDDHAARLKAIGTQAPLSPKALEARQINALLREARQGRHPARDYAILQMLVQTGMRLGECAALHLGDIQLSERQGQATIRAGKGNKHRMVPLNASVRQALADLVAPTFEVEPTVKAVAARWPTGVPAADTPLWSSQKGGKLSTRAIGAVVEALVARCAQRKLVPPDTSAHTLRHTFATNYLADHPGDLVSLAALLGHSSLETTRIYVQPTRDDLARRVEGSRLNAYA